MANRFKDIKTEVEVEETPVEEIKTEKPKPTKKTGGVVKSMSAVFSGTFLGDEKTLKHIPFIIFLSVIAMLYIANSYWADGKIRQTNKINAQLKEVKTDYITSTSEKMLLSKQSEVAKAVDTLGLKESVVPPIKIVVNDTTK